MKRTLVLPLALGSFAISVGLSCLQVLGDPYTIGGTASSTGHAGGQDSGEGGGASTSVSNSSSTSSSDSTTTTSSASGSGSSVPCDLSSGMCIESAYMFAVATDGTTVVSIAGEAAPPTVWQVPVTGGNATALAMPSGFSKDNSVVVDATGVYWTETDGIGRYAPSDGVSMLIVPMGAPASPQSLALHGGFLYWTAPLYEGPGAGAVLRAALDGSGVTSLAMGLPSPHSIVAGPGGVFWTDPIANTVTTVGVDGGAMQVIASSADPMMIYPIGVAVDASHVYWSEGQGTGRIMRANLDGTMPTPLCENPGNPPQGQLVVDETSVYWLGAASIKKVSNEGGTPVEVFHISIGGPPAGLAVDATSVYFGLVGTLRKVTPK